MNYCPICYAPMTNYTDYLDGHTLCESSDDCPYGCYSHRYAYGTTEVMISIRGHKILFGHNYSDDPIDAQVTWASIRAMFEPARAALFEDLRRYKRAIENHLCDCDATDWLGCSGHQPHVCDLCEFADRGGDPLDHKHELIRLRKRVAELEKLQ